MPNTSIIVPYTDARGAPSRSRTNALLCSSSRVLSDERRTTTPRSFATAISSRRGLCPFVYMTQNAPWSKRERMRASLSASESDLRYAVSALPNSCRRFHAK